MPLPADDPMRLMFAQRMGISIQPREGDTSTSFWLQYANTGDEAQRICAFIALLTLGLDIEVSLREGA